QSRQTRESPGALMSDTDPVTPSEIRARLREIADCRLTDFAGPDGRITAESVRASGEAHLVRRLHLIRGGVSIQLHDKQRAADMLLGPIRSRSVHINRVHGRRHDSG